MFTRSSLVAVTAGLVLLAAGSSARAASTLFSGQTLGSGQSLTSPDDHYELTMQDNGDLVVMMTNPTYTPRIIWSSETGDSPGATALLQGNGNLEVRDAAGATIWSNDVTASGCANLVMQDDGNLVAYTASGAYWETNTVQETMRAGDELMPGQTLLAPGGYYKLTMATNGVLELTDSAGVVWHETGTAGSHAILYSDGDFEIRSPTNVREWYTETYATADYNSVLELTSTGALELVEPSGTVSWNSGTAATRTGLHYIGQGRSFTACPPPPPPPPTPPPAPTPIHTHKPVSGHTGAPVKVRLPGVKVSIEIRWHYVGATTWASAARVKRFPRHAHLTVTCRGRHGCPTHTVHRHGHVVHRHGHRLKRRMHLSAGASHLHRLMRALVGRRFHAGDAVVFTVTEPGHRPARSEAIIRRGRPPRARSLS